MKTILEYIDAAKEVTGSDYMTAKQMGISRAAISRYRNGFSTPDQYAVFELARILGISEREIFIDLELQTEKNPVRQQYWKKLANHAPNIILSIIIGGNLIMSPTPSQAAPALEQVITHCILC